MPEAAAVIAAAGRGTRFGGPIPKVFVPLGGRPMLQWSLQAYTACGRVSAIVLVVPPDLLDRAAEIAEDDPRLVGIVPGGQERPESVRAGLEALRERSPEIVCVHDGARPLVDRGTIERSIDVALRRGAAIAAVPATDTIKRCAPDGRIEDTPPRGELYHAQTPQTFRYDLLMEAYERAPREGLDVTDDAQLVERMGHPVYLSEGHRDNLKITTREDLARAEWLLRRRAGREVSAMRVGTGYDVHAFAEGRALILGGVRVEHERGLAGHSDADVLFHAISDALLGAAALGDIGTHFPDSDPRYAGADSAELAARVVKMLADQGFRPANVDATVICQRPKLAPHIDAMRAKIASALGIDASAVSVKATTTERLGFEGRGEGIAAQATVLIAPL
ncbi:MAG: 2-C-methyl-D-erythritol 4-phosphate cytidylyltransferase [Armatimonadota bacterium]|nr:2-C-methyl-D-erythritol 4-phosphate cytidylyltransferase [Armatimonadota bacterium]